SHEPPQASGTDDPRGDRRATVRNLTPAAVEAGKRGNFGSQTGKGRYSRPGSVAPKGARTRDTGPGTGGSSGNVASAENSRGDLAVPISEGLEPGSSALCRPDRKSTRLNSN